MVKMINKWTGTVMFVDESRVDEYKALGHTRPIPTLDELKRKEEDTPLMAEMKKLGRRKKV